MTETAQRQLHGLSTILSLEKRARGAENLDELGFIIINETHNLVPYRNGVLWTSTNGWGKVQALSGISSIDRDAPFVGWLEGAMKRLDRRLSGNEAIQLSEDDIKEAGAEGWREWFAAYGLWVALLHPNGRRLGVMLLIRDEPWQDHEISLIAHLGECYAHSWQALGPGRGLGERLASLGKGWLVPGLVVVLVALSFFVQVRLSVLAPAQVAARDPWVVRAPVSGVIKTMKVRPNQPVESGQSLLIFDDSQLKNELSIARRQLAVAEAEYRQMEQKAMFDANSKATLISTRGKRDLQSAEVVYLEDMMQRINVKARRGGIAVYDDAGDWQGRPVQAGERILTIADPEQVQLEIFLAVDDAIILEAGTKAQFFLAISPETPLEAVVERAAFEAKLTPSGTMAYRVVAAFPENIKKPRIGLRGTAKVYGAKVMVIYYLMRRPIAAVRRWLGM